MLTQLGRDICPAPGAEVPTPQNDVDADLRHPQCFRTAGADGNDVIVAVDHESCSLVRAQHGRLGPILSATYAKSSEAAGDE
jgi:hypothetical protein